VARGSLCLVAIRFQRPVYAQWVARAAGACIIYEILGSPLLIPFGPERLQGRISGGRL